MDSSIQPAPRRWGTFLATLCFAQLGLVAAAPRAEAQFGGGGPAPQDAVEGRNSLLRKAFTPLATKLRPHVVRIQRGSSQVGYGVVVAKGQVLTAASVVLSGPLSVHNYRGANRVAKVLGRDLRFGVAVLSYVEGARGFAPPIAFGSSKSIPVGSFVAVLGTSAEPLGAGVVSATRRRVVEARRGRGNMLMGLFSPEGNRGHQRNYPSVLHHDSPLVSEHFGSPLVDSAGKLLGINVARPYRGSSHAVGIDALLPSLRAIQQGQPLPGLRSSKRPRAGAQPAQPPVKQPAAEQPTKQPSTPVKPHAGRPWLGAKASQAPKSRLALGYTFGLVVTKTTGPAKQGGVHLDDVIVALDGKRFDSMGSFAALLHSKRPGQTIKLTVLRGKGALEFEVEVKLGKR